MSLEFTVEELMVLDKELYLRQLSFGRLNLLNLKDCRVDEQEKIYDRDAINCLRIKIGKLLEQQAINRLINRKNVVENFPRGRGFAAQTNKGI